MPAAKNKDYEALGKMLVSIYESGYIDKNKTFKMSFLKGVVAGFGGVVGATLVVALLVWFLSLFSDLSVINSLKETIQTSPK